jgi:hypothetical protein
MQPPAGRPDGTPMEVVLVPEQAPRFGVQLVRHQGTQFVISGNLRDTTLGQTFRAMIEFTVPQNRAGVLTGVAASALLPWLNDEIAVELFVGSRPKLGELSEGRVGLVPGTIPAAWDGPDPENLFERVQPGQVVRLVAALGNPSALPKLYPPALSATTGVYVRGALWGRYWPDAMRSTSEHYG